MIKIHLLYILILNTLQMENTNLPQQVNPKSTRKATIPAADIDLADVSKKVSVKWEASSWLTLLWTTAPLFTEKSALFKSTLETKNSTASKRPQYTLALEKLDKKIDSNLSYVKNAIAKKYKKESAKSYYPAFGIETRNNIYELPRDQNQRAAALKLMTEAITEHGFSADEYGSAFWAEIRTEYDNLLSLTSTTDSSVSAKVGDKNVLKTDVKKVLNALILAIKANYPDTYAEELRAWGFQKEKY